MSRGHANDSSLTFPFAKLSGAGNDFIFLNLIDKIQISRLESLVFSTSNAKISRHSFRAELAKLLCRRDLSIGADGLIFIEPDSSHGCDFKWDFYNSDGSSAEMCGNAARCASLWAFNEGLKEHSVQFLTRAGPIHGELKSSGIIEVSLPYPTCQAPTLAVTLPDGSSVNGAWIDSGVPHFVIKNNPEGLAGRRILAQALRKVTDFGPAGANITFVDTDANVDKDRRDHTRAITFERGVEDFTRACGTGAIAAAFALKKLQPTKDIFSIEMPGGKLLVTLKSDKAWLSGDTRFIFKGAFTIDAVLES